MGVVIVDDSASMGNVDRYDDEALRGAVAKQIEVQGDEPTRLNLAKSVLLADKGALLRAIDRRYKLKLYFVSEAARAQPGNVDEWMRGLSQLDAQGGTSRLGKGIEVVLDDLREHASYARMVSFRRNPNTDGPTLVEAAAPSASRGYRSSPCSSVAKHPPAIWR